MNITMILGIIRVLSAVSQFAASSVRTEFRDDLDQDTLDMLALSENIADQVKDGTRIAEIIAEGQGREFTDAEKAEVRAMADRARDSLVAKIAEKRAEQ